MKFSRDELQRLSATEHIRLVEEIWDSIASGDQEVPLTESQRRELVRRLQEQSKELTAGRPWDDVRESLD